MSCDAAPDSVNRNNGTMQFFDSGYEDYSQPIHGGQSQSRAVNPNTIITLPPPTNFPPIETAPVVPSTVIPDREPATEAPPKPLDQSLEPAGSVTRQSMPFSKDNDFSPTQKVESATVETKNEIKEIVAPKKPDLNSMVEKEPMEDFAPPELKVKSEDFAKLPQERKLPAKIEIPKKIELPGKVELEPKSNQLEMANRKPVTGVSGGAGISSEAKFESFKLSDLFTDTTVNTTMQEKTVESNDVVWGPPVVVNKEPGLFAGNKPEQQVELSDAELSELGIESTEEENGLLPLESGFEEPEVLKSHSSDLETVERAKPQRSQADIVRSLQNANVPNRVIYDNTPAIPQQEILKSKVVLSARPIEYYHEIRQIAEAKEKQKLQAVALERVTRPQTQLPTPEPVVVEKPSIPVLQASTSLVRRPESFDFRPLPELSALEQQVIKVGASGPVADEGFAPESFPQNEAPTELQEEEEEEDPRFTTEPLPEHKITTSLLPPVPTSRVEVKPVLTQPLSSVLNSQPLPANQATHRTRPTTFSQPAVILKAAPKRDNWLDSTYDNGAAAKAKFRFVQPKFQRVVEQE